MSEWSLDYEHISHMIHLIDSIDLTWGDIDIEIKIDSIILNTLF